MSGLQPAYHFFQMLQMRALELLPVTRFNWSAALGRAGELRAVLAARGEHLRALQEITRAYEAGVKVLEDSQS